MKGLLFPGQGSQIIGMGAEISERLPEAKSILERANEILGIDLKEIMFHGPMETLTNTMYAQPAIYTCSAMYMELVKSNGWEYDYVAGHSLGEYSALYAARVFSFDEGLRLVYERGKAMSLMNGMGTMTAILGLTEEELETYLARISGVVMANLNTKTQIVVSGDEQAIEELEQILNGNENVKVRRLPVSAAFHSPHMQEAKIIMEKLIEDSVFNAPICNVISNISGKPTNEVDVIKENLINQITGQVRWYDTIISMKESGVTELYEVGEGTVLSKMTKAITLRPKCVSLSVAK